MKKKVLIISIFAAVLMILLPISIVVGTNIVKSDAEKRSITSPLFAKRVNSFIKKDTKRINTNYLGKGKILNIFFLKESSLQSWIDKSIKIIEARPNIFNRLINNIETNPKVVNILQKNSIDINDFKNNINIIKNNPSLLKKEIDKVIETFGVQKLKLPINEPPEPLGFTGQLGCILVFFTVLLPILVMIGTMIATFTIITCLNIGGCFENILGGILEGALQGLTIPGY
ncbi:MAG: hypothetical protein JSW06_00355 [Thermoplasmatales archaeon]|nr:MAG: hypothetical protein JSW06_00355 [Thermoplasmatales archaeon]